MASEASVEPIPYERRTEDRPWTGPERRRGPSRWRPARWLPRLTALALLLVVFDSVATYTHLSSGYAVEGNALVAAMIDRWGADAGLALRTVEVGLLVIGLSWLAHRSRLAQRGLVGVTLVMLGVAVYHVVGPVLLVG